MAKLINVEEELKKLWNETPGKDRLHASFFNLIVYTSNDERKSFFQTLVKSLISKFPCRIIFVTRNTTLQHDEAKIKVHLESISQGEQNRCCEQISIEVSEKNQALTTSLILPHIIPDLPSYLLWGLDPSIETSLLHILSTLVQRVIFDGELAMDLQVFFETLHQLTERNKISAIDLHWTTLSTWRKIIAGFFYNPECFLQLEQSKVIKICYNSIFSSHERRPFLKAAYLQGWLVAQMGWKFKSIEKSPDMWKLIYQNSSEIFIELIPQEITELPCGTILHLEIESTLKNAYYSFKRNPSHSQVCIYQSTSDQCYLPHVANLPRVSVGQEILNDLFNNEPDRSYQKTLEILSQINWSSNA